MEARRGYLGTGGSWENFHALTPFAVSRIVHARLEHERDERVRAEYAGESMRRSKRMKPLSAYLSRETRRGNDAPEAIAKAFGVTEAGILAARAEASAGTAKG